MSNNRRRSLELAGFAAVALLVAACSQSNAPTAHVHSSPTEAPLSDRAGGCAGTAVTDAIPPDWAQSGWFGITGATWPVPWAMGAPGNAVAYLWATELVAGPSPRGDGSTNKVLWVTHQPNSFVVEGHPIGSAQPTVSVPGGPSIIDAPIPGCWTFKLTTTRDNKVVSTINLQVLPPGSLPPK